MPELRLLPLEEVFGSAELDKLQSKLAELGVGELPEGEDVVDLDNSLTESQLDDFMDRLAAHDIACDMYLPIEFDGTVMLGEASVGSVYSLADALEEIREELDIAGDEEEDEEEEAGDIEIMERELAYAWQVFAKAALTSTKRKLPLHVIP